MIPQLTSARVCAWRGRGSVRIKESLLLHRAGSSHSQSASRTRSAEAAERLPPLPPIKDKEQFRITNLHGKRVWLCIDVSDSRQSMHTEAKCQKISSIEKFWGKALVLVLFIIKCVWCTTCDVNFENVVCCWEWQVQGHLRPNFRQLIMILFSQSDVIQSLWCGSGYFFFAALITKTLGWTASLESVGINFG